MLVPVGPPSILLQTCKRIYIMILISIDSQVPFWTWAMFGKAKLLAYSV